MHYKFMNVISLMMRDTAVCQNVKVQRILYDQDTPEAETKTKSERRTQLEN